MVLRDLLDVLSKERRRKQKIKAVQNIAVGVGIVTAVSVATGVLFAPKSGKETREDIKVKAVNTVENIKDTIQKKAGSMKESVDHATLGISNVIKDVHMKVKAERIKEDIHQKVDIHPKEENILDEII